MQQIVTDFKRKDLTKKIIQAFYEVYNNLGYGFLEKVYERAIVIELKGLGLNVTQQHRIKVFYKGNNIGDYFADLLVEGAVALELKAAERIEKSFETQLINYLKSTNIEIGLLLNFGPNPTFVRKIFTNDRKNLLNRW